MVEGRANRQGGLDPRLSLVVLGTRPPALFFFCRGRVRATPFADSNEPARGGLRGYRRHDADVWLLIPRLPMRGAGHSCVQFATRSSPIKFPEIANETDWS